MSNELPEYTGSCHCGAVRFRAKTALAPVVRCNCSLCRRKGILMATAEPEDFELLQGEEQLSCYQFNTMTARHYFCSICGIYTFHRPRTDPRLYRINVGCLEGVDSLALEADVIDGASLSTETPADTGSPG